MTAATYARLPLAAGGAVLELTGNAIHWGFARYMRAPLANTGILALMTFGAMAGSNALYMQRHEHPAPMFKEAVIRHARADVTPVIPATRQKKQVLAPLPTGETTGSVAPKQSVDAIGNAEVAEIQRKLTSMQIFDGTVDGLYGPRTARAIKTFETRMGLPPKGELTRALLEAVRGAPVILPEERVEPLPTPDPLPQVSVPKVIVPKLVVTPQAEVAPAAQEAAKPVAEITEFRAVSDEPTTVTELAPLPAPAPLSADVAPVQKPTSTRAMPGSAEEAFELAAETAEDVLETIIDGVQQIAMTTPPKKKTVAEVQPLAAQPVKPMAATAIAGAPATEAAPVADTVQTASTEAPQVGVPLAMPEEAIAASSDDVAVLEGEAKPEELMPAFSVTDPVIVAKVQRGLGSLGFLHGPADGVAGEATAKAIRNFEVYYNYKVTGRISPELLDLLVQNGASI